jgi:hypothetical protein
MPIRSRPPSPHRSTECTSWDDAVTSGKWDFDFKKKEGEEGATTTKERILAWAASKEPEEKAKAPRRGMCGRFFEAVLEDYKDARAVADLHRKGASVKRLEEYHAQIGPSVQDKPKKPAEDAGAEPHARYKADMDEYERKKKFCEAVWNLLVKEKKLEGRYGGYMHLEDSIWPHTQTFLLTERFVKEKRCGDESSKDYLVGGSEGDDRTKWVSCMESLYNAWSVSEPIFCSVWPLLAETIRGETLIPTTLPPLPSAPPVPTESKGRPQRHWRWWLA